MVLRYRQLSFDTAHFAAGSPVPASFSLFDANADCANGVTAIGAFDEKTLIRWLAGFGPTRGLILEQLSRSPSALIWPEVVQPFYCPGEGDIDLVICERSAPNQSVAIEAKRVKVEIIGPEEDKLHKIRDIGKGVEQANRLHRKFGFFQHYLAVVTAVEAIEQTDTNIPCRGLRSYSTDLFDDRKTHTRIVDFPGRNKLNPEIGIIFMEVVQPSRIGINARATFRICVHRPAQRRDQSQDVTNRLAALMMDTSDPTELRR